MPRRAVMTATRCAAVFAALLFGVGCSHWPWHHPPPPPPAEVHELDIGGANAASHFPQYWKRNTLLVDLSAASGSGSITLKPVAGGSWPVRLALRVTPAAVGRLEVRGDQGVTLPITPGPGTVDLELAPGIYSAHTPQVSIAWGATTAVPPLPQR